MDRDGFDNLDKHFQQDLSVAKEQIKAEVEQEFLKYEGNYTGTAEMQAKARATVNRQKEAALRERITAKQQQLEQAHFQEFGDRASALEQVTAYEQEQETPPTDDRAKKEAAYEQRLQEYFAKQANERNQDDKGR